MRVLAFYSTEYDAPVAFQHLVGDELFNALVETGGIVQVYRVDGNDDLLDFEMDYNIDDELRNTWCVLVDVSEEIYADYTGIDDEKGSDGLWDYAAEIAKQIAFSRNDKLPVYAEEWGQEIIYKAFKYIKNQ